MVGAGGLGVHHVRILRDMAGERFVGFYDDNPARASQVAAAHGVYTCRTLDELLSEVDAVSIVVPTTSHFEVARAAISAGKHVFVEKPFTVSLEEADELIALADDRGVLIQVGHVERFNRAVRAAMPYIDSPRFIESDRLAPFNPRGSDVAVVLDLMIHDLDLVHTLVRSPIAEIRATGIPVLTPQIDIANARLAFENGAVANITASRVSRERLRKLRLFQRSGYLSLDLAAGTGEFFRMRPDFNPAELMHAPRALESVVERIVIEGSDEEPLVLELTQFVDAVMGRGEVSVTGREGREALKAALQIVGAIEQAATTVSNPIVGGTSGA